MENGSGRAIIFARLPCFSLPRSSPIVCRSEKIAAGSSFNRKRSIRHRNRGICYRDDRPTIFASPFSFSELANRWNTSFCFSTGTPLYFCVFRNAWCFSKLHPDTERRMLLNSYRLHEHPEFLISLVSHTLPGNASSTSS